MANLAWHIDAFVLNGVLTGGDRLYSPGPPSWSPDGTRVSYVWAGAGTNQIWVQSDEEGAAPLSRHPILLEETDGTDRRDVGGGPQWSPDGQQIAYVGTNPNRSGRTSIFVMDVASGAVRQLTDHPAGDRTPRWSPDGTWIACVVNWDSGGGEQIAIVPAEGGTPLQLTADRHANTDVAWSPGSRLLAFSTQRSGAHPFAAGIGIVQIDTGDIELVDHPDTANERTPRFGPDERRLAFVSDRDGFDSLWLYDLQNNTLEKVDVGRGEVAHPTWSPDGTRIAFTLLTGVCSRAGCVDLQSGDVTWLSPQTGSAFWPAWSPDSTQMAYAWSDSVTPREIWVAEVATGERRQLSHTAPPELPDGDLLYPERHTYAGADGLEIEALLYRPSPTLTSGGGILWVHGGPNWLVRDAFDPFLQYLAAVEGHTILAPNVRGSTGYGRAFMERNYGDYGGMDQADWVAGVDILTERAGIDRRRIGIWGRSYGGFATMLSLGQSPETFCCGIAQFGAYDWHELWDKSTPWVRRLMIQQFGHPVRDRDRYVERSPITHVDKITAPLLMLHGGADVGVPPAQSLILAERLAARDHPHEVHVYPSEGHGFNEPHHIIDAASRIAGFFNKHLLRELP